MIPAYGLTGANQALGYNGATGQWGPAVTAGGGVGSAGINTNRDLAMQQAQQGIRDLRGYNQPGVQAQQLQAALSGALGQQAQQQAYNNFQSSPGQAWLQQQAERGVLRNAAATGGLRGGNVLNELQRNAMGMAQQDFQNQFNNAGAVADRGMQAQALMGNMRQLAGQAATQAGGQGVQLASSQIGANAGVNAARIAADTALRRDAGQYAFTAGQNIGDNYANTTSALANLANQQGQGISGAMNNYTGNLANLLTGAGTSQSNSAQALAQMLSGIAVGQMNPYVNASQVPGVQQTNGILGGIGQAAGGIGYLGNQAGWWGAKPNA